MALILPAHGHVAALTDAVGEQFSFLLAVHAFADAAASTHRAPSRASAAGEPEPGRVQLALPATFRAEEDVLVN